MIPEFASSIVELSTTGWFRKLCVKTGESPLRALGGSGCLSYSAAAAVQVAALKADRLF